MTNVRVIKPALAALVAAAACVGGLAFGSSNLPRQTPIPT